MEKQIFNVAHSTGSLLKLQGVHSWKPISSYLILYRNSCIYWEWNYCLSEPWPGKTYVALTKGDVTGPLHLSQHCLALQHTTSKQAKCCKLLLEAALRRNLPKRLQKCIHCLESRNVLALVQCTLEPENPDSPQWS